MKKEVIFNCPTDKSIKNLINLGLCLGADRVKCTLLVRMSYLSAFQNVSFIEELTVR